MAFKKGQSGNPGGRPKDAGLRDLARAHTEDAIQTLVRVMKSKKSPAAAQVTAACALLDRGYGKPTQVQEITGTLDHEHEHRLEIPELARLIAFSLRRATHEVEDAQVVATPLPAKA
jgi:hypothetical protein